MKKEPKDLKSCIHGISNTNPFRFLGARIAFTNRQSAEGERRSHRHVARERERKDRSHYRDFVWGWKHGENFWLYLAPNLRGGLSYVVA